MGLERVIVYERQRSDKSVGREQGGEEEASSLNLKG